MSYAIFEAIYGRVLPSTTSDNVPIVRAPAQQALIDRLMDDEIIEAGYDDGSIWCGVNLEKGFDECVDFLDPAALVISPATADQLTDAKAKLDLVPQEILDLMTPVGYYYVVTHS